MKTKNTHKTKMTVKACYKAYYDTTCCGVFNFIL